jgi:hypothetical protein
VRGKAARYLGHNPAGGLMLMIVLMIVMLLGTALSGLLVYGADQHAGPFKGFFAGTATAAGAEAAREGERQGAMNECEEEDEESESTYSASFSKAACTGKTWRGRWSRARSAQADRQEVERSQTPFLAIRVESPPGSSLRSDARTTG